MKHVLLIAVLTATGCVVANTPRLGVDPVEDVVAAMTREEKARFLIGSGLTENPDGSPSAVVGRTRLIVPGAAGTTYPIERLGIPAIVFADGPAGVRIDTHREGDTTMYACTHFPMATLLGATWNDSIVAGIGRAIGVEAREYGVDVMLAPAMNIQRHPLCGRNYEYYSEDPLVSGRTASAYIEGLQSTGVGACVKHLAANNQETYRKANESIVSQRALREIYLKGFERVVRNSSPWTLMTSYNYLNGHYTSESPELIDSLLRREWGFDGVVVSDWYGGNNAVAQMKAGNDLLQPGYAREYDEIMAGLGTGLLDESVLDRNIARVLRLVMMTPRFKGYRPSASPDLKAHAMLARRAAAEGMVLLRNENGTLPLGDGIRKIAMFGNNSYNLIPGGSGSGDVNRAYEVTLGKGLSSAGYVPDARLADCYNSHIDKERRRLAREDNTFHMAARQQPRELKLDRKAVREAARDNDIAVLTVGFAAGEFADRSSASFRLDPVMRELLGMVCREFHDLGKKVVVLLNVGGVIETASWRELPDAILCVWQSGQEGGNSIADVLSGRSYPSGKLPMTFPVDYSDHPSNRNFPVDSAVDIIFKANTLEHRREVPNIDHTVYEEDVYVGYRYFNSFDKEVSYPFGYGLSYTTFGYSDANVTRCGSDGYELSVTVSNTGHRPGKEIVQVYATGPRNIDRPVGELVAYAKTRELKPGESQTLMLRVDNGDLSYFDEKKSAYVTPAGPYRLSIGASSRDIREEVEISVNRSVRTVKNILAPPIRFDRLDRTDKTKRNFSLYYQRATLFENLPVDSDDIVFLGNSITNFCEWHELLDNPNVKNRGISGDTYRGILQRLDPVTSGQPAKIFLMIGINNLGAGQPADSVVDGITHIVRKIKEDTPGTQLFLQSILPVNDEFMQYGGHTNRWHEIESINTRLEEVARAEGIPFVDVYSVLVDPLTGKLDPRYTNDGLHLLASGYLRWAEVLKPYLQDVTGKRHPGESAGTSSPHITHQPQKKQSAVNN
ncbi:MAG: glycoside hydrolase family 3 C-terminal domain-containing protein [Muribaculaceae bacterium]|nr:glycoside hydrolase family 3 C-terminal domain-containing protein [Muribaculaceae bacterium]